MTDDTQQIREVLEELTGKGTVPLGLDSYEIHTDTIEKCCKALTLLDRKVLVEEGRLREIVEESLCPMIPKDCNEDNDATCECCSTNDEVEERLAYLQGDQ